MSSAEPVDVIAVASDDDLQAASIHGFQPTEGQLRYLRLIATAEQALSLQEISKIIEVPVSTIFDWLNDPMFQEWVATSREQFLRSQVWLVYRRLFDEAMAGSAPHMRMFLQRFDPKFDKKKGEEVDGQSVSDHDILQALQQRIGISKQAAIKLLAGKMQLVEPDESE